MNILKNIPQYVSKVLAIDLSAISYNYKMLTKFVAQNTEIAVVLKANAYGLGARPIMGTLIDSGCKNFFFAFIEEAIEARTNYPNQEINIYVLNGVFPGTEGLFQQHNLIPCIISYDQAIRWSNFNALQSQKLACNLHVDTGLGREGLSEQEFDDLLENKKIWNHLNIKFLMSHLVHSSIIDEPTNCIQLKSIKTFHAKDPNLRISFAHSAGTALGDQYQFDMVRIGMAVYGYKTINYDGLLPLKTCIKAYAKILRIRELPRGKIVGYDGTYVCKRKTRIALLAVGHADGIMRASSNKGHIIINGQKSPIIGIVSMDVMMVDITSHPTGSVEENMWATLYSDADSARKFAMSANTSIYELFVKQGSRYHRIYNNNTNEDKKMLT